MWGLEVTALAANTTVDQQELWAHLPNAKHIYAVLADVRERPEAWEVATDLALGVAQNIARRMQDLPKAPTRMDPLAQHAPTVQEVVWRELNAVVRSDVQVVLLRTLHGKINDSVWAAMGDCVAALIAWDSAADLLDCTPDVLRAMIDLAEPPVCHQAALLLPYALVRFGEEIVQ